MEIICGIDEVGRGPLVGNVVAAAVILPHNFVLPGLNDSKKLTSKQREELNLQIKCTAIAWGIGQASPAEIDQINILYASLLAMSRAFHEMLNNFSIEPNLVLVDGNRCPELSYPTQAIVKGDSKIPQISAASIIAKVYRDQQMMELHKKYPEYGFNHHMGYPTKQHLEKIKNYGVTPEYRKTFKPVKAILLGGNP
jgi:ribonuclease HII